MNIYEKLLNIQAELKAPKNQYNEFGKYHYRSCEDILEGLKPLLKKYKVTLTISDEIVQIGDRYYVKATATLIDIEEEGRECISSTAFAREDEKKTGMDLSQLTSSTSSYARKYALNGLFCIDDTKDSDATNKHDTEQVSRPKVDEDKQGIVDNSLATDRQIKAIYAIAKNKSYTEESLENYVKSAYNKDSVKELTRQEASDVIQMLNEMAKER